jgi:hypothetical protein
MTFITALIVYYLFYGMIYLMPIILLVSLLPEAWRSFLEVPIMIAGLGTFLVAIWQAFSAATYYGKREMTFWQAHKAAGVELSLSLRLFFGFSFKALKTKSVPATKPTTELLDSNILKNEIKSIIDNLLNDSSQTNVWKQLPQIYEKLDNPNIAMELVSNAPYNEFLRIADKDLSHERDKIGEILIQELKRLKTYFDGGKYKGFVVNIFGYTDLEYSWNTKLKIKELVDIIQGIPDTGQQNYFLSNQRQISEIKENISSELKFDTYIDYLIGYALESFNGANPDISELNKIAGYILGTVVYDSPVFKVNIDENGSLKKITLLDRKSNINYARWKGKDITHVRKTA